VCITCKYKTHFARQCGYEEERVYFKARTATRTVKVEPIPKTVPAKAPRTRTSSTMEKSSRSSRATIVGEGFSSNECPSLDLYRHLTILHWISITTYPLPKLWLRTTL
jgi:hypothetical protein